MFYKACFLGIRKHLKQIFVCLCSFLQILLPLWIYLSFDKKLIETFYSFSNTCFPLTSLLFYFLSVAHSTPDRRASWPSLKHTPTPGHLHPSLPLSRRLCPQTDEWLAPFHCKFLSNVTFSVMPTPIILFKIAAPSSPSPTELPSLLFSP